MLHFPEGYPDALREIAECLHSALTAGRLNADVPTLALDLTEAIRRTFGGGLIYIPAGYAFNRLQRNEAIRRAFNGNNAAQVAKAFGITSRTVYSIAAAKKKQTP